MARKIWMEVALNGPWTRERQPLMPVTVEEIVEEGVACARAGASILHVHAYDETTGRQNDDWNIYARIIEGIRANADVIVYPTLPLAGSPEMSGADTPETRFAAVEELARRGLIECAVIDPGSVNFSHKDDRAAGREGFVYLNPESHLRYGLALAARHGIHPCYALYEPGFARLGAALAAEVEGLPQPIYRMFFSDDFAFGFPATRWALTAYHRLLSELVPEAPWMVAGLAVDIRPVIAAAVERGGHVRVGLEDAPWGTEMSNLAWLEEALETVRREGGEPATTEEVRAGLKRA
ncbi:MAG: 3-keto-5-aminohexanoate cleavage protein [Rhodovibrionaceae bacterium]